MPIFNIKSNKEKRSKRFNNNLLIITITIQLTGKKHQALAASEEHYRNMTSISPVGMFHTDVNGIVPHSFTFNKLFMKKKNSTQIGSLIYVNPSWIQLTGLTLSRISERNWYEQVGVAVSLLTIRNQNDTT